MQSEEETVSELVAAALEHMDETGTQLEIDEVCREHPDLRDKVARVLEAATRVENFEFAGVPGLPRLSEAINDRYRLDARLGAGAMGAVYEAKDLELKRRVAIKILHNGILDSDSSTIRFEREAEALAAIEHPSVVTIYDRGSTLEGAPLIVMELIDGVPLSAVADRIAKHSSHDEVSWMEEAFELEALNEGSVLRQAVSWCAELASGLEAAHARGIVHRDVKPSNVMLRRGGGAVLIDFGTAADEEAASLTRTGAAVGTPAYMAPEILEGGSRATPQSDVYGLTATLFHLVTGRAPYTGTPSQIIAALATREPRVEPALASTLQRDLLGILEKGMNRLPSKRYLSMAALRADLLAFLSHRPVSARPTGRMERLMRRARRSQFGRGLLAAAVLTVGVLGYRQVDAARAASRAAEFNEAALHMPANFGVVSYDNRRVGDPDLEKEVAAVFDRLVASGHRPEVAHCLRAAFRHDRGETVLAKADMQRVADRVGTPYARSLSDAYGLLGESASAADLDLTGLPDPESAGDAYLAGFHELRQRRYGGAAQYLKDERLDNWRHAAELRAMLLILDIPRDGVAEVDRAANVLFEASIAVEQKFGGRSSMTAHLAAYALSRQQRFDEALEICQEGLELCPAAAETAINAARAAWRNVDFELAGQFIDRAASLLPHYPKAFETGLLVRMSKRDFDDARTWLGRMPFDDSSARDRRTERSWRIQIDTYEALHLFRRSESQAAQELASGALALFKEQGDSAAKVDRDHALMCESIVEGDPAGVFDALVKRVVAEPLWPDRLRTLDALMRSSRVDPGPDTVAGLMEVVTAISDRLGRRWQAVADEESPSSR